MTRPTRRTVLKGIAGGTIGLTLAGYATARGRARYLVSGRGTGLRRNVERTGYTVQHEIADGQVLLVLGPEDASGDLQDVNGVQHAVRDFQFTLERPELVESAEETTDDSLFPLQWDKQVTSAAEAHERATGAGTTIAVIDTGAHFAHPDLTGLDSGTARLFRAGEIRSGTGEVEVPAQRDGDDAVPEAGTETVTQHVAEDVHGHGSHVSGIAAGSDDGTTGIVGTAPDAGVVACRVFWWTEDEDGNAVLTTTTGDILLAIDYSADIGVDAMNMSIGTPPIPSQANSEGFRPVYQTVIQSAVRRGSVVVVSAGNSAANLQQGGFFTVPNSVAGAMSISATGPNDELVFYSNYGTNEISVGAPGGGYETLEKTLADSGVEWPFPTNLVLSSVPPDIYSAPYAYFAGTSMAAPQVTGTAALVREVAPDANANQVEQAIEQGADLVEGKSDPELGAGRLNAADALDNV